MKFQLKDAIVGMAAVALISVTPLPAFAQGDEPSTPNRCELQISQPVQAGGDSTTVSASMSESIGQLTSAEVESASGVRVVSVKPNGNPPTAAEVTLNTSQAKEGEWTLTLRGQESECSGTLTVQGG